MTSQVLIRSIWRRGGQDRNRENLGGGRRAKKESLQREEERKTKREPFLQRGFLEVTVLNITEECGMLDCCQGKHTGRITTAAPVAVKGCVIHTQAHTNIQTYVSMSIYSKVIKKAPV